MKIAHNLTELVGNTPLLRLSRISAGCVAEVLVKLETFNPLSSVKDRTALAMIEDAERRGLLQKNSVVIEPTGGNTGIALAFVCASRGYRLILTMPDAGNDERYRLLAAFGAEIVLTDGARGMRGAIEKAEEIAEQTPNSFIPGQFNNPANPEYHRKTTAEEIWRDTRGKVDILVAGVGTGGTLTGIGEALKQRIQGFRCIAVEPADSPVLSGGKPAPHKLMGLGAGFVPAVLRTELIDEVITVRHEEAGEAAKRLAREEGLLAGISTGANVWAALQVARRPGNEGKTVVTIACDTGERYLGTWLFNDTEPKRR
jgi:cysteine synthase A